MMTMFMGEVIQGLNDAAWDLRGDFFNNDCGGAEFMTYYTPNSGIDNICIPDTNEPAPCSTGGQAWLVHNPWAIYVSARSRHPGGVVVVMGDGSAHFVIDQISLGVWRSLSRVY